MIDTDARKSMCCDSDWLVQMWDMESGIALGGAQIGHKRGVTSRASNGWFFNTVCSAIFCVVADSGGFFRDHS